MECQYRRNYEVQVYNLLIFCRSKKLRDFQKEDSDKKF
jgi:hypothetical protein